MNNTTPSPTLDNNTIADTLINGVTTFAKDIIENNPIIDAVVEIFPPLIKYIVKRIETGQSPNTELMAVILAEADATADELENAKFGATHEDVGKSNPKPG